MSISISPTPTTAVPSETGPAAQNVKADSAKSAKSRKAEETIEKFEGMFMSMMLKEMRKSGIGEGFFPGDHSDTYGGMFDMFVGEHLAKSTDTGLEQLFRSSAALKQLEEYVERPTSSVGSAHKKGLEEYRNEQFRAGAVTPPGT